MTFASAMSRYYPDERTRREEALSRLNDIFECYLESRIHLLMAVYVYKDLFSHGHALGPMKTIETVMEIRNELGATDSDPMIELSAYYVQAIAKAFDDSWKGRFLFPALGIVVVGECRSLHNH